jgi:NDP-sugar pyrophosphorylase family protein
VTVSAIVGVDGLALVFPADSAFELDLAEMMKEHRTGGAVLTVGSVRYDAGTVARRHEAIVTDRQGWCTRFLDRPARATIRSVFGRETAIDTTVGLYLLDCEYFRRMLASGLLAGMLRTGLDWDSDLLPWLVAFGAPVRVWPIEQFSDPGPAPDCLETIQAVLAGDFPQLTAMPVARFGDRSWVYRSSLGFRGPLPGRPRPRPAGPGLATAAAAGRTYGSATR